MNVVETADKVANAAEKKKQNDARHRRFRRSLEPATDHRASTKGKRCPPALALKIKAMPSAEVVGIFQIFSDCEEDWARAEVTIHAK